MVNTRNRIKMIYLRRFSSCRSMKKAIIYIAFCVFVSVIDFLLDLHEESDVDSFFKSCVSSTSINYFLHKTTFLRPKSSLPKRKIPESAF